MGGREEALVILFHFVGDLGTNSVGYDLNGAMFVDNDRIRKHDWKVLYFQLIDQGLTWQPVDGCRCRADCGDILVLQIGCFCGIADDRRQQQVGIHAVVRPQFLYNEFTVVSVVQPELGGDVFAGALDLSPACASPTKADSILDGLAG